MMRFVALLALVSLAPLTASAAEIVFVETLKNGQASVTGMQGASDPAVSPDGRNVYVAAYASSAVAIFSRDPATGQLTFSGNVAHGVGGATMLSAFALDVSPDGN